MMRSIRTTLPIILFSILVVGCGSGGGLTGSGQPALGELPFTLEQNVRSSLALHFFGATKPPVGWNPVIHFDYKEISRELLNNDRAVVTGEFIFSLGSRAQRRGTLRTYFVLLNENWVPGLPFDVAEGEVSSIQLKAEIRDQISSEPVVGATVVAHRIGDDPRSSMPVKTDTQGVAQLEVFQGAFEITANHPEFIGAVISVVNTEEGILTPIQMKRLEFASF
jgi:hypothetical protein